MKDQIKQLRVSIDQLAQLTKELKPYYGRAVIQQLTTYERNFNSEEICKAYDSLILAKAWLGKVLGELKCDNDTNNDGDCHLCYDKGGCFNKSPYANDGKRKTVEDIEPAADTIKILEEEKKYIADKPWNEFNHIEKVDWLRTEIEKLVKYTQQLWKQPGELTNWKFAHDGLTAMMSRNLMYTEKALEEARFWLGFELQRIKENSI